MLAALVGLCAQETDDGSGNARQEAVRRLGKLATGACRIANRDDAAASGMVVGAVAGDITAASSSVTEGVNDTGGSTLPCD